MIKEFIENSGINIESNLWIPNFKLKVLKPFTKFEKTLEEIQNVLRSIYGRFFVGMHNVSALQKRLVACGHARTDATRPGCGPYSA